MSFKRTKNELFGLIHSYKNSALPRNLEHLINHLPVGHHLNAKQLIFEHTLFPLISIFLSDERKKIAFNDMIHISDDLDLKASNILGIRHGKIKLISEHIRYCPKCLKENYLLYGECYVHRLHQFHSITFCYNHLTQLITHCPIYNVSLSNKFGTELLSSPNCFNGHDLSDFRFEIETEFHPFIKDMSNDLRFLINNSRKFNDKLIFNKYQIWGIEKGYVNFSGIVRNQLILKDLLNQYSKKLLEFIGVDESFLKTSIVSNVFHSSLVHPTFHILIMEVVAGKVENFFSDNLPALSMKIPFQNGPWLCRNKICTWYKKPSIEKCERKLDQKGNCVVGWFTCPICGYTYANKSEGKNKYRVITKGFLWEEELMRLYNNGLGVKEIANKLGTHQIIVNNQLRTAVAKNEVLKAKNEVSVTINLDEKLLIRRQKVLDVMTNNPGINRRKINNMIHYDYQWLLKYDKEWMDSVLPPSRRGKRKLSLKYVDIELNESIKRAAEKLYLSNPPRRIVKTTILNSLPKFLKTRYYNNRDNLPLSEAVINRYIEKIEDYQIRRLPLIINELEARAGKVSIKSLLHFTSVFNNCSKKIETLIIKQLRKRGHIA